MANHVVAPCAACRFLRRKCTEQCIFAPYFPPYLPEKFINVHKVFGSSNVSRLLSEIPPDRRQEAVDSLVFEAEARLQDPVYACIPQISQMQAELRQLQASLFNARADLSHYMRLASIPGPFPEYFVPPEAFGLNPHQHENRNDRQVHQQPAASVGIQTGAARREVLGGASMNNYDFGGLGRFDPRSEHGFGAIRSNGGDVSTEMVFSYPNLPVEEVSLAWEQGKLKESSREAVVVDGSDGNDHLVTAAAKIGDGGGASDGQTAGQKSKHN